MKKSMLVSLMFLLAVASCVPLQRERPRVAMIPRGAAPLAEHQRERLENRVKALRALLEDGALDPDQSRLAANLIRLYEEIAERVEPYRPLERDLLAALLELEARYFELATKEALEAKEVVSEFLEARAEILELFVSKNYAGVVERCVSLKNRYGPKALDPELEAVLSMALARQGLYKEAIEIAERVMASKQDLPNLTTLIAEIPLWYLELQDNEKAFAAFERFSKVAHESSNLANRIGARVMAASPQGVTISKYPQHPTEQSMLKPDERVGTETLEGLIQEAYKLSDLKKFEEARELLLSQRNTFTNPSEIEAIDQALRIIDQREEQYLEARIAALSRDRFTLENARRLAEEERYDEAIAALDQLLALSPGNKEARALRDNLVETHINKERNRAARLFLAAKNVSDPLKKERYLRSCLEILKGLVDKYPSSPLIPKINSHIAKVSRELERL